MKLLKKSLFLLILMALLCCSLSLLAFAEDVGDDTEEEAPEEEVDDGRPAYTITYYHGDTPKLKEIYKEGDEITLRADRYSNNSYIFFGWFSDDGVLYEKGATITATRDISFYEASGREAKTENDLRTAFNEGWCYTKLGTDLTLNSKLNAGGGWSTHILDLNGHTLNISNSQYGTGNQRNGVIILGKGTINFTSNNPKEGAFCDTSKHGYGDGEQRLWIGKDVKIVSNTPILRVTNDMSGYVGLPTVKFYGDLTCPYLVRSTGLSNVNVNIYDTAKITITGTDYPLLRDTSTLTKLTIMKLNIYGGTFTFPEGFKGFVDPDDDRMEYVINGGTFNIDITYQISVDYKVKKDDATGTYMVYENLCPSVDSPDQKHKYIATKITVTCDENGIVDYHCQYCDEDYTSERAALGHNVVTLKTSDLVNTVEKTTAGIYTNTCTRCGFVDTDYFYPDPSNAYITVKVKYKDSNGDTVIKDIRVQAKHMFGFDVDDKSELEAETYLTSYGFDYIPYRDSDGIDYKFKMENIIAFEIPLGTTRIKGGKSNRDYVGVFYKKANIEEITLPMSLEIVEQAGFAYMPDLKKINGIEYISYSIDDQAFAQNDDSEIFLDTLRVNARSIASNAFKNLLATRIIIGKNVTSLADAFTLSGARSNEESKGDNGKGLIKEIFFEEFAEMYPIDSYPEYYGHSESGKEITINSIDSAIRIAALGDGISVSSSMLNKAPLYFDHTYDTVIHPPTCLEMGYTAYECLQCGLSSKSNFVPNDGITHQWERSKKHDVASTCSKEGYEAEFCPICESVRKATTIIRNPNKHTFSADISPEPGPEACTSANWNYYRRCTECRAFSSTSQGSGAMVVLGHIWLEPEVILEPTCTEKGVSQIKCDRCSVTQETEIEMTAHSMGGKIDEERIEPTCYSSGKNVFRCKYCGLAEERVIDMLSFEEALALGVHQFIENVVVEPTTNSVGIKETMCTLCFGIDKNADNVIPQLVDTSTPVWVIVLIAVGGVLLVGGIVLTLYFTLFKKNNASKNYKYKFNTFKK